MLATLAVTLDGLRICRISRAHLPVIDGAALHVHNLTAAQVAQGAEVWVLQPHAASHNPVAGFHVERVCRDWISSRVFSSVAARVLFYGAAALRLMTSTRRRRYDVVHIHGDSLVAGIVGAAARVVGRPAVLTVHGRLKGDRFHRALDPWLYHPIQQFIAVSEPVRKDLIAHGVPPESIEVISSGVDLARFPEAAMTRRRQRRDGKVRVVSIGRLDAVKGFEYLIAASSALADASVEVSVVGDGPERAALVEGARGRPIAFVGARSSAEVTDILLDADVFVLSSVDLPDRAEGTPTALMEAMAAGLPIVCTDSANRGGLLTPGTNALVVPQRDSRALADAILTLARDEELRRRMGAENRRASAAKAWPALAARIADVYRRAAPACPGAKWSQASR